MDSLANLLKAFSDADCERVYVKVLQRNNNSKNQVYFGTDFSVLNIFPFREIVASRTSGVVPEPIFKAAMDFYWLSDEGSKELAPNSQLILYPEYPEVRFSGFLKGSVSKRARIMDHRVEGRVLFLGVNLINRSVLGYVADLDEPIAKEFKSNLPDKSVSVFYELELSKKGTIIDTKPELLKELCRIHRLGFIEAKRRSRGLILPCLGTNCGGYTLEAELGIDANGISQPDFLGWEVKQYGVNSFSKLETGIITLMTPEPTSGFYGSQGAAEFVRKYGYKDPNRYDRLNFNGKHQANLFNNKTGLTMELVGFNPATNKLTDANGMIALLDQYGEVAAGWPFHSLLEHWNRKHNKTAYVPSRKDVQNGMNTYAYGYKVKLGEGTNFLKLLTSISKKSAYYDPGLKLENISTKPKVKPRSQFRISVKHLSTLYDSFTEEYVCPQV